MSSLKVSVAIVSTSDLDDFWELLEGSMRNEVVAQLFPGQTFIATKEMIAADVGATTDPTKYIDGLIARADNKPVGCLIFIKSHSFYDGRCFYMCRFIVKEDFRGKGIAKQLMIKLAHIAKDENAIIEWLVSDNNPNIGFYHKIGAKIVSSTTYEGVENCIHHKMKLDHDAINKLIE